MIVSHRLHIVGNAAIRCPASHPKNMKYAEKMRYVEIWTLENEKLNYVVIPIKGNDGHFSKTESNAVAGDMSVFTTVDYNPAEHGMIATAVRWLSAPAAHRRQRAHSMSGINSPESVIPKNTLKTLWKHFNWILVEAKIKSYLCILEAARERDNG